MVVVVAVANVGPAGPAANPMAATTGPPAQAAANPATAPQVALGQPMVAPIELGETVTFGYAR